jgi:coproporphyrinogen III oxidase-like Fe-S oxidoreductase
LARRRLGRHGCGAHSTRDGVRWKNVSATENTSTASPAASPTADRRSAPVADERLGDALFTGLRLTDGIDSRRDLRSLRRRRVGALRRGTQSVSSTKGV